MDVTLDSIPTAWPLVTQMFLISNLFGELYNLALERPVSKVALDPRLWLMN